VQIVRTDTRPARLALCVASSPNSRVLRRAFRLLGGRWGGQFDVLIELDSDGTLASLQRAMLEAADPDYIFVVDPRLDTFDWQQLLSDLDLQPFEVVRLREGAEHKQWRSVFRESPTAPLGLAERQSVADYDRPSLTWQEAAEHGLPLGHTRRERLAPREQMGRDPLMLSRAHLTVRGALHRWLIFGDDTDSRLAAVFWSVRALGGRPTWAPAIALYETDPPFPRPHRTYLYAPGVPEADVAAAGHRWSGGQVEAIAWTDEIRPRFARGAPYFASHLEPAPEFGGLLRFSIPSPVVHGEALAPFIPGVAEYQLQSPTPGAPDGVLLARVAASIPLIAASVRDPDRLRVTRHGIAELRTIGRPGLVTLPDVDYEQAVAAPFEEAGLRIAKSDKGRYQQRSLELGRGAITNHVS
jgi:hypothetical protein